MSLVRDDGAIANRWLEVTVRDTLATGLAEPDVFYFANKTGDATGDGVTDLSDFNLWNAHKFTSLPTQPDPVPPEAATQEPGEITAAIDELARLRELEARRKESSDTDTLAAQAVDRLLATYWK